MQAEPAGDADVDELEGRASEPNAPAAATTRPGLGSIGAGLITARLDGLAAIGDRERIEAEAEPLLQPGTYLEPFALRALGLVRADEAVVKQAIGRFEAIGLD